MPRSRNSAHISKRSLKKARTGNSMKTTSAVILVVGVVVGLAHAGEPLQTLKEGSWLCTTPEAYDLAIVEQHRPNSDLEGVKERFLAEKLCIYADAGFVEKMMVPFATVLERQGNMVKVTRSEEHTSELQSQSNLV